jgi:hypothetical protein
MCLRIVFQRCTACVDTSTILPRYRTPCYAVGVFIPPKRDIFCFSWAEKCLNKFWGLWKSDCRQWQSYQNLLCALYGCSTRDFQKSFQTFIFLKKMEIAKRVGLGEVISDVMWLVDESSLLTLQLVWELLWSGEHGSETWELHQGGPMICNTFFVGRRCTRWTNSLAHVCSVQEQCALL